MLLHRIQIKKRWAPSSDRLGIRPEQLLLRQGELEGKMAGIQLI